MLRGIARFARERGPWSIFHEPRSLEDMAPKWLAEWDGDGIIARLQNQRIAEAVAATGIPAIDVLGVVRQPSIPLVHVDDMAIGRIAMAHLRERGFRHFGFCGIDGVNWSDQRAASFAEACEQAQVDCEVYRPASHSYDNWEREQDELAAWVSSLPRPVGIMACNDPRGQRLLEACRRAGAAVPDEIAVIGVDNDEPVCEIADPPLSSVIPDHFRVGYEAAALLERRMSGDPGVEFTYIPPLGVITRHSTDVLALADRDVASAMHLIRQRACEGLTVEDVCDEVAMSRSTLQRRFRTAIGSTVHDEIVRVRLRRAQELLAETNMPIAVIAERTGFKHQEYLGVVFKANIGRTPADYRRRSQRERASRR